MILKNHKHRIAAISLATFFISTLSCFAQAVDSRVPTVAPAAVGNAASAPFAGSFPSQEVVLIEVKGDVLIQRAGTSEWINAIKNQRLSPSDMIHTGDGGAASITFDRKARIDLLPGTRITVEQAGRSGAVRATVVQLDFGRLKAEIQKLSGDSKFEVKTPTAVASVRGTTIFMNSGATGDGPQGKNTDLFVDSGLVKFFPLGSPNTGQLVDKYGLSSIFGDGSFLDLKHLSEIERKEFIDSFEAAFKGAGNPQTEVEEGSADEDGEEEGDDNSATDLSGIREGQNQRNLSGGAPSLGLKAAGLLLSEGLPGSGNFNFDLVSQLSPLGIVSEERVAPRNALLGATTQVQAQSAFNQLIELRNKEREKIENSIRGVLNGILEDQEFNFKQARIEIMNDQQTGKVFKDVHGNRVRTDQYIFQPSTDSVNILSLTLRAGEYQPGVTSVLFGVKFNENIPQGMTFRDLPWNDYMNVVTREEMADALDIERQIWNGVKYENNPDYDALAEQFVVHESSNLAAGGEGFWPKQFYVEFRNPTLDMIRFDEIFGNPTTINDHIGSESRYSLSGTQGGMYPKEYDIQAIETQTALIAPMGQESLLVTQTAPDLDRGFVRIQRGDVSEDIAQNNQNPTDGSQTDGFAQDVEHNHHLNTAAGVEYYVGEGDRKGEHPAYFADDLDERGLLGTNVLLGFFIPIDNDGNILGGDRGRGGFSVDGIRDLFVPNKNVNGGDYNLEVIFAYGYEDESSQDHEFREDFRIDAIITPELLTHHEFVNTSYLFPQSGGRRYYECEGPCLDD